MTKAKTKVKVKRKIPVTHVEDLKLLVSGLQAQVLLLNRHVNRLDKPQGHTDSLPEKLK